MELAWGEQPHRGTPSGGLHEHASRPGATHIGSASVATHEHGGRAVSDATIALVVMGVVIALFVWNRLPVGIVSLGTVVTLWATGLLTLDEATAGFGDPVIVFIATLFVVSEGIDRTGITAWAGARLVDLAGESPRRLLLSIMALCAVLTALISLNGAVAALLPMVA